MKHKVKVVMLLTNKSEIAIRNATIPSIVHSSTVGAKHGFIKLGFYEPQHIYVTVSQDVESIEEGDWCICYNRIERNPQLVHWSNKGTQCRAPFYKREKIIATTDPKLKLDCSCLGMQDKVKCDWKCRTHKDYMLPQLQQSFLKEYVANPNGEYEVECGEYCTYCGQEFCDNKNCRGHSDVFEYDLNQDNTVNITIVEEKMYSREEVITLIKKYRSDDFVYGKEHKMFKDWIKENL